MKKRKEYILLGRSSDAIATGIIDTFGHGARTPDGKPAITEPGRVVQFEISAFEDGEVSSVLFADGDRPHHPVVQSLTQEDKKDIERNLDGARVTIVHSMSGVNTSIRAQGLTFLASHLKNNLGVDRVSLISPALPYMRSDRNFSKEGPNGLTFEFNAVACLEFARQLKHAGVDRVVGFEPHSRDGTGHYYDVFGKKKVRFVNMGAFFADAIRGSQKTVSGDVPLVIVGSPDGMNKDKDYGIARARSFCEALYKGTDLEKASNRKDFRERPMMFGISKERLNSKETVVKEFYGNVAGKLCIIIDDIISGGSTTLLAAKALKERDAAQVIAICTHGVLTNGALQKLASSTDLDRVMLTDTIPSVHEKLLEEGLAGNPKFVVESISPLVNHEIARALKL